MSLKIALLKFLPHLRGTNELLSQWKLIMKEGKIQSSLSQMFFLFIKHSQNQMALPKTFHLNLCGLSWQNSWNINLLLFEFPVKFVRRQFYFKSSKIGYQNRSNSQTHLDSKVDGANMGSTWVLLAPDGPHVGPMNFAIWASMHLLNSLGILQIAWKFSKWKVFLLTSQSVPTIK